MDEGLQRLYWACRRASGFPGDIPDESQGPPSTTAILKALGLKPPSLQDIENIQKPIDVLPSNSIHYAEGYRHQGHTVPSSPGSSSLQDECLPSPATSSFSLSSTAPNPKGRPYPSTVVSSCPATLHETDMSEQLLHATLEVASSSRSSSLSEGSYSNTRQPSYPVFDMDSFLDTSSCLTPSSAPSMHNPYTSIQFDVSTMLQSSSSANVVSAWPSILCDSFSPSLSGSLTVAHKTAT